MTIEQLRAIIDQAKIGAGERAHVLQALIAAEPLMGGVSPNRDDCCGPSLHLITKIREVGQIAALCSL